ncbi:MAG: hypothetical protein KatS3mg110_0517 [Pirellulaceae bacterium]|nr:MAG: hypothetical protein KatS3mg110_0517 [Pirellulaceae bacterium]
MGWKRSVGFPLIQYQVQVDYTIPRPLTVIEEAILRLVRDYGSHPSYRGLSLFHIFDEILCVADPDTVVLPVLVELFNHGAVQCQAPFESLDKILLKDLSLTELGRRFAQDGELAGVLQSYYDTVCYDPVQMRCMRALSAGDVTKPRVARLPLAKYAFPEATIREFYDRERPKWLPEGATILECKSMQQEHKWQYVTGEIVLEPPWVQIRFDNDARTRYVESLPSEVLESKIFGPAMLEESWLRDEAVENLPVLPVTTEGGTAQEKLEPLKEARHRLLQERSLLVLNAQMAKWTGEAINAACVVLLGTNRVPKALERVPQQVLLAREETPSIEGWLGSAPGVTVFAQVASLRTKSGDVRVPLARVVYHDQLPQPVKEVLQRFSANELRLQDLAIPALWLDGGEYEQLVADNLASAGNESEKMTDVICGLPAQLRLLKVDPGKFALADLLISRLLEKDEGIGQETVVKVKQLLRDCPLRDSQLQQRWEQIVAPTQEKEHTNGATQQSAGSKRADLEQGRPLNGVKQKGSQA